MGLQGVTEAMVEESNWCFSKDLAQHIEKPVDEIYQAMQTGTYAQLAKSNPVAYYNFQRLNYSNNLVNAG